ncbi:MAG: hypothetical protein M1365_01275 [Actinobacteria bacterium]|nr:hypothetical protein [Actinomycetota bacterium]
MSQLGETFFTSVGCMDGRVQCPVTKYGKNRYQVKYADTITEAGLVGLLAKPDINRSLLDSIKKKIMISIEKHHSKGIIVHGHQECAGNPVEDILHKEDTIQAAKVIRDLLGDLDIEVHPVFVIRDEEEWKIEEL